MNYLLASLVGLVASTAIPHVGITGTVVQGTTSGVLLTIANNCNGKATLTAQLDTSKLSTEVQAEFVGARNWARKDTFTADHFQEFVYEAEEPSINAMLTLATRKDSAGAISIQLTTKCDGKDDVHTTELKLPIETTEDLDRHNSLSAKLARGGGHVSNFVKSVPDHYATVKNALSDAVDTIKGHYDTAKDSLGDTLDTVKGHYNTAMNSLGVTVDTVKGHYDTAKSAVNGHYEAASDYLKKKYSAFVNFFSKKEDVETIAPLEM